VSVVDTNGSGANASVRVTVFPELAASAVAFPETIDVGQSLNYSVTATGGSGGLSYQYASLPPGCARASTARLQCEPNAPGNYSSSVVVRDAAGAVVTIDDLNVTVAARPTVSIRGPSQLDSGQALNLTANTSLGTPPYTFVWSGLPNPCTAGDSPFVLCTPTASGVRNVYANVSVEVLDAAGGSVRSGTLPIVIAPDLNLTAAAEQPAAVVGTAALVQASASLGTGPYSYSWSVDGGSFAAGNSTLSPIFGSAGQHQVSVRVTDALGWIAETNVTVDVVPPLVASLLAHPSAPLTLGRPLEVNATPSGGLRPYSYAWSGLPEGCSASDQPVLDCTPTKSGSFSVTVLVRDGLGEHQSSSVDVLVNPSLRVQVASSAASAPCAGPIAVNLSATISGGSVPYRLTWNFGDGTPSSNASPIAHSFAVPGSYAVRLNVTDAAGATSSSWANLSLSYASCPTGSMGPAGIAPAIWVAIAAGVAVLILALLLVIRRRSPPPEDPAPVGGSEGTDTYGDDSSESPVPDAASEDA